MEKEILLYEYIYSYSVANIIKEIEAAKGNDLVFRVNTPGGEVMYAIGIFAKYQEFAGNKKVKVDGAADSCGAILCCYAKDVECLDVSTFLFHRASYGSYYESDPRYFTEDAKASLINCNKNLRAAMEGKMTDAAFTKETGVSYDELFSMDNRIEVELTADQALRLGLVNKVTKITPEKKAAVEAVKLRIAAERAGIPAPIDTSVTEKNSNPQKINSTIMTIEKLIAEHPEVYAAAVKHGVTAERDRIGSFMAFNHIDPKAVKEGIDSGETMTETQRSEFSLKAVSSLAKKQAAADNAEPTETPEPETEGKDGKATPETAAALASTRKLLGLPA